jgi:transmembrane sensor
VAKRTQLPFAASLQDEAAQWVARRESAPLGIAERQDFEDWLGSSPAHLAAFETYDNLWNDLGIVAPEFADVLEAEPRDDASEQEGSHWFKWTGAIAASLALVWSLNFAMTDPVPVVRGGEATAVQAEHSVTAKWVSTDIGEQRALTMNDGSRITLNTDTKLRTDFAKAMRIVQLEQGEAYFEVAHDPGRPFIVQSPFGSVRAVGTKFIVRIEASGKLSVIVTEGKVLVAQDAATLINKEGAALATPLIAGQELSVTSRRDFAVSQIANEELGEQLAWRQGDIVFEGEPLGEAAAQLQRYTKRKIIVDARVAHYSVGGYFRTNELDAFAETLESVFPVKALKSDDELRIVPAR